MPGIECTWNLSFPPAVATPPAAAPGRRAREPSRRGQSDTGRRCDAVSAPERLPARSGRDCAVLPTPLYRKLRARTGVFHWETQYITPPPTQSWWRAPDAPTSPGCLHCPSHRRGSPLALNSVWKNPRFHGKGRRCGHSPAELVTEPAGPETPGRKRGRGRFLKSAPSPSAFIQAYVRGGINGAERSPSRARPPRPLRYSSCPPPRGDPAPRKPIEATETHR